MHIHVETPVNIHVECTRVQIGKHEPKVTCKRSPTFKDTYKYSCTLPVETPTPSTCPRIHYRHTCRHANYTSTYVSRYVLETRVETPKKRIRRHSKGKCVHTDTPIEGDSRACKDTHEHGDTCKTLHGTHTRSRVSNPQCRVTDGTPPRTKRPKRPPVSLTPPRADDQRTTPYDSLRLR